MSEEAKDKAAAPSGDLFHDAQGAVIDEVAITRGLFADMLRRNPVTEDEANVAAYYIALAQQPGVVIPIEFYSDL